jgi:hypothetical protein
VVTAPDLIDGLLFRSQGSSEVELKSTPEVSLTLFTLLIEDRQIVKGLGYVRISGDGKKF